MRYLTDYDKYEKYESEEIKQDFNEVPDVTTKWFGQLYMYLDIRMNEHPSDKEQVLKDIDDFINNFAKFPDHKIVHCAVCGDEIEDSYFMVGDNFLQVKYFDEQDGSDNIFCSESCLMKALSVQVEDVEDCDNEPKLV